MVCDRCGGPLESYRLNGRDAQACRECGYLDVPVRHEPDGRESESWDEAIDRFQRKYADVTVSESRPAEEESAADD